MEHKMNFLKAVKNDYGLGVFLIFVLVGLGFGGYFTFIKNEISLQQLFALPFAEMVSTKDFYQLTVFVLIVLFGLFFFVKRVVYIKSFEGECRLVEGKVVNIRYVKDRCGVDVEFLLDGNLCKKHFTLFNNSQTKYVHMDSQVQLIVKDDNPKKSLILDLYFD